MFQNQRYITCGIETEIPLELQLFMWECVDIMSEPKDYFQVFRLENFNGIQKITHFSEQPKYHMEYLIPTENPTTAKVYIIDSDEYSTMLMANEIEDMLCDYSLITDTIRAVKGQDYYDDFLMEI